jgi:hypothetical protein
MGDSKESRLYTILKKPNISQEDMEQFEQLLVNKEENPNIDIGQNNSLLKRAIGFNYEKDNKLYKIVELLLEHCDINLFKDQNLITQSIFTKQLWIIDTLFRKGYSPQQQDIIHIVRIHKQPLLDPSNDTEIFRKTVIDKFYRKLKNIEKLKQHVGLNINRQTGITSPKFAYIIMGHGGETTETKVVPDGCMLVSLVHSGEVSYFNLEELVERFNSSEKDKLLDPITNYTYITKTINTEHSVNNMTPAIYREGDTYYDLTCYLISYWDSEFYPDFAPKNGFLTRTSGVLKLLDSQPIPVVNETISKNTDGKDLINRMFNSSVYPTPEQLNTIIDTMADKSINNIIYNNPSLLTLTTIKQSELFTKLGPGVYYNLNCRSTEFTKSVENLYTHKHLIKNNDRQLVNVSDNLNGSSKENIARNLQKLHLRKNPNPNILKAINEAARIRAPLAQRAALKREQERVEAPPGTPRTLYPKPPPAPPSAPPPESSSAPSSESSSAPSSEFIPLAYPPPPPAQDVELLDFLRFIEKPIPLLQFLYQIIFHNYNNPKNRISSQLERILFFVQNLEEYIKIKETVYVEAMKATDAAGGVIPQKHLHLISKADADINTISSDLEELLSLYDTEFNEYSKLFEDKELREKYIIASPVLEKFQEILLKSHKRREVFLKKQRNGRKKVPSAQNLPRVPSAPNAPVVSAQEAGYKRIKTRKLKKNSKKTKRSRKY